MKRILTLICLLGCSVIYGTDLKSPNVLFILVDDLGWADLGCYGSKVYDSPNVDALATQSVLFTDFYAGGPVCSPTRASIMTGKCTARTGVTKPLAGPDEDPTYVTTEISSGEYTLAEAFQDAGYITGHFGKWHLGHRKKDWAINHGFDVAIGGKSSIRAWRQAHPDKPIPVKDRHPFYFSPHHSVFMENGPEGEYLPDRLTNEIIRFMNANKDKRFFAYLPFNTVHTPLQVKPEALERYKRKMKQLGISDGGEPPDELSSRKLQNLPEYAAMVYHMDENIGRLMSFLKESGLDQNTLVVFTSDNGGKGSVTSNYPLRGRKHDIYEGGIRVPTLIRMPGNSVPARVDSTPLISDDFYPTLLELCGLKSQPQQHLDGRSFAALLRKEKAVISERPLYWHYPHSAMHGAIRLGGLKLIHNYNTGICELYDLKNDIGESKDLASKMPAKTEELKKLHQDWLRRVWAKFPDGMKKKVLLR